MSKLWGIGGSKVRMGGGLKGSFNNLMFNIKCLFPLLFNNSMASFDTT